MVVPQLDVPLLNLEKALQEYLAGPMDAPFDVDTVDRAVEEPVVPMCAPSMHHFSRQPFISDCLCHPCLCTLVIQVARVKT